MFIALPNLGPKTFQRRQRGGVIDPLTLSPSGWFRSYAGTYQSSGGSAATADTDPVGEWQDQSGNSRHVTQATGSSKPTLKTNIQNGLPVLRFDGGDSLSSAVTLANFVTASAYTAFVVFQVATISTNDNTNTYNNNRLLDHPNQFWGVGMLASGGPTSYAYNWDGNEDHVGVTIATSTWTIHSQRHESGTLYVGKNGDAESSVASGNTSNLSTNLRIGSNLQGDIGEILLFPTALSSDNVTAILAYLNSVWAIY